MIEYFAEQRSHSSNIPGVTCIVYYHYCNIVRSYTVENTGSVCSRMEERLVVVVVVTLLVVDTKRLLVVVTLAVERMK